MIAALFVISNGPYAIDGIDLWDIERDARKYNGPHPVIAHPPCERWGRYWSGGPMLAGTSKAKQKGDDGGCFKSALASVRKWGGVIEHPEGSHAWGHFGLSKPRKGQGWIKADDLGGFTCSVEQGHYGHMARKATWLYANKTSLPELQWGPSAKGIRIDPGFHSKEERSIMAMMPRCKRLSKHQRTTTPEPFRNILIDIAKSVLGSRGINEKASGWFC